MFESNSLRNSIRNQEEKPQSSDIPHKQLYMSKINNMHMNARFAQCAV
jgi:hypothetical protein